MSAKAMGMVFDRYPASDGEFKLALALADNASEDGRNIYPSVPTMATKSRQDVRSVQRHLRRMLAIGWLLEVRPAGGRGRPAEYRINPRWVAGAELPLSAKKGDTMPPLSAAIEMGDTVSPICSPEKGDTMPPFCDQKRVTPVSQKGDTGVAPYMNHKEPYTPLPPKGGASGFDALCAEYPKHRRNMRAARREWLKLSPDGALWARIVRAARAQARSPEWQAENGKRVPNLSKWLANEGWLATHDETALAAPKTVSREGGEPAPPLTDAQLRANKQRATEARNYARDLYAKGRATKRSAEAAGREVEVA